MNGLTSKVLKRNHTLMGSLFNNPPSHTHSGPGSRPKRLRPTVSQRFASEYSGDLVNFSDIEETLEAEVLSPQDRPVTHPSSLTPQTLQGKGVADTFLFSSGRVNNAEQGSARKGGAGSVTTFVRRNEKLGAASGAIQQGANQVVGLPIDLQGSSLESVKESRPSERVEKVESDTIIPALEQGSARLELNRLAKAIESIERRQNPGVDGEEFKRMQPEADKEYQRSFIKPENTSAEHQRRQRDADHEPVTAKLRPLEAGTRLLIEPVRPLRSTRITIGSINVEVTGPDRAAKPGRNSAHTNSRVRRSSGGSGAGTSSHFGLGQL